MSKTRRIVCTMAVIGLLFLASLVQGQEKKTAELPLMEVSKEGRAWMAKQVDIAQKSLKGEDGGLIDGSVFLSVERKVKLNSLAGARATVLGYTVSFFKLADPEDGYQYFFLLQHMGGSEERWYVSESPWYKDQFPEGIPPGLEYLALWKKGTDGPDKRIQSYCELNDLFEVKEKSIHPATVIAACRDATLSYRSECRDAAKMQTFDLPKDRPIGYIGLIDANPFDDPIVASMVDDMRYWPEFLAACGYKVVADAAARYIPVADNPAAILARMIEEQKKKGIRDFYLNLAGHGNLWGVHFSYKKDGKTYYKVLTSEKLFALFDAHQDCTFTVSTVACQGGGYATAMKRYKDPSGQEGRVTIFLQTKGHGLNQEGRLKGMEGINGAPKAHSTYYNVFFVSELLHSQREDTLGNYGAAHLRADRLSRMLIPSDPEVWRSGKSGGTVTGKLR
ncbi:hypothetical protein HYW11_00660 [Candidatus Peregrinibacteria bacterium]|nr:hypothetical protein [Candidatus Peregrinibacteria bacterium]